MSGFLFSWAMRVSRFLEIGGWVVISVRKLPGLCEALRIWFFCCGWVSRGLRFACTSPVAFKAPPPLEGGPGTFSLSCLFVSFSVFCCSVKRGGTEQKRLFHCFSLPAK